MDDSTDLTSRLMARREACGLSQDELAARLGLTRPAIYDLEGHEDELFSVYGAVHLQRYAKALATTPSALIGITHNGPAIDFDELSEIIAQHCKEHDLTIEGFEDRVGWHLAAMVASPARFADDISLGGLRDLCRHMDVDWRQVILSL